MSRAGALFDAWELRVPAKLRTPGSLHGHLWRERNEAEAWIDQTYSTGRSYRALGYRIAKVRAYYMRCPCGEHRCLRVQRSKAPPPNRNRRRADDQRPREELF